MRWAFLSYQCSILLFMILEDARQATAAARRMLAAARDGACGLDELREALAESRAFMAAGAAFQTAAAEQIARRERHGDGGAEVLASSAGQSQREAHNQVSTAAALQKVPGLRDAVQSGDVSQANARRLAEAITKTSSETVAGDDVLLAQAQSMRPEQFAKTAQRWIGAQQADGGTAEYLRQRARRYLRIYDTDDGMVALHGEFDKVTGTRIRNRLRHTAGRLLDADKKLPKAQRRKFPQCMADALQHHTDRTCTVGGQGEETSSSRNGSTGAASDSTGCDSGTAPSDEPSGRSGRSAARGTGCDFVAAPSDGYGAGAVCGVDQPPQSNDAAPGASPGSAGAGTAASESSEDAAGADAVSAGEDSGSSAGAGWVADITVLAHVDDTTGELIGELSDGSKLPAAVLEELSCNARWAGLVFDRAGDAIWRSRSRRTVTDTQWQALLATYGGCFHCGAPAGMCQAHHITPYSQGGATSLRNLIMVCWNCHHKIHHHNWRVVEHSDGSHTLHPPDDPITQPRYGPALADDSLLESLGAANRPRTQQARIRTEARASEVAVRPDNRKSRTGARSRDQARARARDPALW